MSKEVEQRVVEMRFENKQFESGAATSMSTLDKLKQKLNMKGATKGLNEVDAASKKIDFSILSRGVETVQARFSAMQVVAVTALANITNSALNAGKNIASALTISPIITGFQEYETQINAVQTILANTQSKGSTLSEVNAALDELNKYADLTIYNFTEMTRNIGTFTAAGVDLDKSVSAIKGIANLAAVSGSTSQQASTAMYQLSQALAAGKVQLMDWNSVVNAGMGGEVFQTALKRTATQMGQNVDELIEKYGSFRESLTKGNWLTAEVLTETLTQLSGAYTEADLIAQGYSESQAKEIVQLAQTAVDAATKVKTVTQLWDTMQEAVQSGWTETWEILIGDFEEAKSLLTELSDTFGTIIANSSDARNALLYDAMTSNWKKITDGITEAGLSAEDFKDQIMKIGPTKEIEAAIAEYGSLESAFKNGALSSDLLNKALTNMTGTTTQINGKMTELRGELKTNKDIIDALTKAGYRQSDLQELITKQTKGETIALNDLSDAQLMSIGYTAEQVQEIRQLAKNYELANGSLKTFIDNVAAPQGREMLVDALRVSLRSLIAVFGAVGDAWREVFPPMTSDQLLNITQSIRDFALALRPSEETLDKLKRSFRGLFSILGIGADLFKSVVKAIFPMFSGFGNLSGSILDVTASLGDWVFNLRNSLKESDAFGSALKPLSKILQSAGTAVADFAAKALDKLPSVGEIFSKVGDVAGKAFTFIKDTVGSALDWIRENVSASDIFAGLAGGGIFAAAKKFSGLIDSIKEALEGLFSKGEDSARTKFSDILSSVHDSLESFQEGIKVASLVAIAAAVGILSSALRKISEISPGKIAISLGAIQLLIMELNAGFSSLSKTLTKFNAKGTVRAGIALMAMAEAINILADAMTKMSELSMAQIAKGLIGVAGGITALSLGIRIIGKGGVTLRTSVAILALAKACEMLSESLAKFGSMSWDEIGRGLTAMGGSLAIFVASLSVLSKAGGFGSLLGSLGVLVASKALDEISENLERLGNLSWGQIGNGLYAMGGALAEFMVALGFLSKIGGFGALLGGTAVLIAVQSLDEISENLERLGNLSWDEIGKGLAAMGGALAELSVAVGLLGKLAGFSGILGAGAILIGVQGLGDLADALQQFGSMSWDSIGRGLAAMGGALVELGLVVGLLGSLAPIAGILGAGAILIGVQGLGDLADALQQFGSMTWDEIGRGLTAMGGALLELGVISGLLGTLAPIGALVGSGSLLLAIQGLDDLASALERFGTMSWDEIGRGLTAMGAALGEVALGGLINTFSGFGAGAIAEMAEPLGNLADSVKKWIGVVVPDNLGDQIGSLADGVAAFTFKGLGASAIAEVAAPLGTMADSVRKWDGVTVAADLGTRIGSLAEGVKAFTFGGLGAGALATAAPSIGEMADSVRKWDGVTVPDGIGGKLTELADGVKAFSFAFIGGWSLDTIIEPLSKLPDSLRPWNDVHIPEGLQNGLESLAAGIEAFSFGFLGGWSIGTIVEPLSNLAEPVKKWNDVHIPEGLRSGLENLAAGLNALGGSISTRSIDKLATPLGSLSDSVRKWSGISLGGVASELSMFASSLGQLGQVSISSVASGLSGASQAVSSAISSMISSMTSTINMGTPSVSAAFTNMIKTSFSIVKSRYFEFQVVAQTLMDRFAMGIASKEAAVHSAFTNMLSGTTTHIRSYQGSFYDAGSYLVEGFIRGMGSHMDAVREAARRLAEEAYNAAMAALDAHSPSRRFMKVGLYTVMGYVNGMIDNMRPVAAASKKMATTAIDAVNNSISAISDEVNKRMNVQPTIRPILDLTDVKTKATQLNTMFSRSRALSIDSTMRAAAEPEVQNGVTVPKSGNVFQFTQNNYSPKALSRIEIYRQTKNQFSALERVVRA